MPVHAVQTLADVIQRHPCSTFNVDESGGMFVAFANQLNVVTGSVRIAEYQLTQLIGRGVVGQSANQQLHEEARKRGGISHS